MVSLFDCNDIGCVNDILKCERPAIFECFVRTSGAFLDHEWYRGFTEEIEENEQLSASLRSNKSLEYFVD